MRIQNFNSNYINNYSAKNPQKVPQFKSNVCFNIQASCGGRSLCKKAVETIEQLCISAALTSKELVSYGSRHWVFSSPKYATCVITEKTSPEFGQIAGLRDPEIIMACVRDVLANPNTKELPIVLDEEVICNTCVSRAQIGESHSRLAS